MRRFFRFLLGLRVQTKIAIAVIVVGLGIFVVAYFEPHKLWIDEEVNEDFPAPVAVATTPVTTSPPTTAAPESPAPDTTTAPDPVAATTSTQTAGGSDEESSTSTQPTASETTTTTAAAPTTTTLPPTTTAPVPQGPVLLSSSEWISLGHPGTGTVLVYRQPDGSHVIRFENLDVSNGPDLLVILSASPLVDDRGAYSAVEYLSLGDLKGNQGNQNYEVSADVSLDDFQTVAIWCRRFNYTFNAADIHSPPA